MKKVKIGIQGGKGSFSEEAAQIFSQNHGIDKPKIIYLISSKAVLAEINNIENVILHLPINIYILLYYRLS